MNILDEIFNHKKSELALVQQRVSVDSLEQKIAHQPVRARFADALVASEQLAVIAEYKTASPSLGDITRTVTVRDVISAYDAGGASAISVLTDKHYFNGSLENLQETARITNLPLLRKDFIFDPYQIYEAKAYGASAILLIAAMLDVSTLQRLTSTARDLQLDIVFEAHTPEDVQAILKCNPSIIGVNARNLQTMEINLTTLEQLVEDIPASAIIVAESGIKNAADARYVKSLGAHAILVGTSLMQSDNPAEMIRELCL